jgi:hypothetical protein
LLILIALATWLIPAGAYQLDENGAPIPGTYQQVPSNPQKLLVSALMGPINGMYGIEDATGNVNVWNSGELFGAIDVALFVLIIGGFLGVTMKTGAINAGIAWVVAKLKGKEKWMFPVLMTIFAIGGTSYGMAEETLAFYALIITVMLAAGYDGLAAGALILLGAGIGVIGSTVNPFATGIASGFADTTISEGLIGRIVILAIGTVLGIIFVMRYAEKVKKDPSKSLIYSAKAENEAQFLASGGGGEDFGKFTGRHKFILVLFFLAFVVMVYGVIPWEDLGLPIPTWWWWFPEMAANFLLFGIVIGIVGRLKEKVLVDTFVDGARDMLGVGADHRRGARHHCHHEQRPDHRHRALLGGTGGFGVGRRRLHPGDLPALPAALIPDSLQFGAGDRFHADHGAALRFCRRAELPGRDRVSDCQRAGQPGYAHFGGGHGWSCHCARRLWHVVALCLAAAVVVDGAEHGGAGGRGVYWITIGRHQTNCRKDYRWNLKGDTHGVQSSQPQFRQGTGFHYRGAQVFCSSSPPISRRPNMAASSSRGSRARTSP